MTFPGVEHRIETVRELDGVEWINDSKGTNVDSTLKAIDTMTRPTVLILGGSDKKVSFVPLAKAIAASPVIRLCVLIGDTAEQIRSALQEEGYTKYRMAGYDFDHCLAICRKEAIAGGCVLLSPACASFDMFHDFEDRGRVFKQKVLAFTRGRKPHCSRRRNSGTIRYSNRKQTSISFCKRCSQASGIELFA